MDISSVISHRQQDIKSNKKTESKFQRPQLKKIWVPCLGYYKTVQCHLYFNYRLLQNDQSVISDTFSEQDE